MDDVTPRHPAQHAPAFAPPTVPVRTSPTAPRLSVAPGAAPAGPDRPPKSRRALVAGVALVCAGVVAALGVVAVTARNEADDAKSRAESSAEVAVRLEAELDIARIATDDARASTAAAEADLADATAEAKRMKAEVERVSAELAVVTGVLATALAELAPLAELQQYRDDLMRRIELLGTAQTRGEIVEDGVMAQQVFNRLVGTNVESDAIECKQALANNGYALYFLIASSLGKLLETDPAEAAVRQAEILESDVLRDSVFDDACS